MRHNNKDLTWVNEGAIIVISDLIQRLIEWQERKEMTNWELADLLDVSPSTISYLKPGRRQPGHQTVTGIWRAIPELKQECEKWAFPGEVHNGLR